MLRWSAVFLFVPCLAFADNWPSFRGPHADGHADAKDLPITWSETENIRWKTAIPGKAWSSPVVWNDQIWLTNAQPDGKKLFAVCVDRQTGRIIHDIVVFSPDKPAFCYPYNSPASPTPAIEPGRVYVHFGSTGTACLDTATGKILWTRQDLPCDHWRGAGSSPILFENLLILTFDGFDRQYLAALDKMTGHTVWKRDRDIDYGTTNGDYKKAYSTPIVIDVGGSPQLISPSAGATQAFDPRTGKELWRVQSGGMNAAARPLYGLGMVFASSADGGFKLFAVRPDGHGDVTATKVAWKNNRGVPTRCSFLLLAERLFLVNESGVTSLVDAKTGKTTWQGRPNGAFSSSPIFADGRVYVCNETDGSSYVLEPGDEMKVLAVNKLDDGCMASPAAVGKSLFLRTKTHLYCIEKK
jgi:outer membrane protein assembly factor BamB